MGAATDVVAREMSSDNGGDVPYWIWPLRWPPSVRAAARGLAALAAPACRGRRWILASLAIGTMPFLAGYWFGSSAHQALGGVLLLPLCLDAVRCDARRRGMLTIGLAYLFHSMAVIAVAACDPRGAAAVLPDAGEYWRRQDAWIRTGRDPEYELRAWLPAHAQLIGGGVAYAYASFGAITFCRGFYEVDLMNYYNARLIGASRNPVIAVVLGWHAWSFLRGLGFVLLVYEVVAVSFRRFTGARRGWSRGQTAMVAAGLGLLVGDGVVKALMLGPVRDALAVNLR